MAPLSTIGLLATAISLVSGRSIAHLGHRSIFSRAPIDFSTEGCPAGSLCVNNGCTSNFIGLDVLNCGGDGVECDPSQLCLGGSCQNVTLTDSDSPTCPETRAAGEFCGSSGSCESIQFGFDPLRCGDAQEECEAGSLCLNSRCVALDLGSDPTSCGPEGTACDPGSWCLEGACQQFQIGNRPQQCETNDGCGPSGNCDGGSCRALRIGLDSNNCGPDSTACASGEVCLASGCRPLDLGDAETAADVCGEDCGPGFYCDSASSSCSPIVLGIDSDSCGSSDSPCEGVCFSGVCIEDLNDDEPAEAAFDSCGDPQDNGSGDEAGAGGSPGAGNGGAGGGNGAGGAPGSGAPGSGAPGSGACSAAGRLSSAALARLV